MEYTPNRWLVLKIKDFYKVFATWSGGYADGDSWKLNSGITKVYREGDYFIFEGVSGSIYKCHTKTYGTNSYGAAVLSNWKTQFEYKVLPEDFNFLLLNNT